ncbi:MAG TPA: aldose 1-epimerase [Methylomirabilota bacterium]|jgi:aldose 1-epimerase|nr:aldose 1-epimerase [Methylomirabilota bacterium]
MDPITLRSGALGLVLAPRVGGAIARFWSEQTGRVVDLLRPTPDAILARHDVWATASFPLVPWSNRIREGRFVFGGRAVSLPLNRPPERHAIHGLGFQTAWTVADLGSTRVVLEHRHAPGAWPWAYRAVQQVALTPQSLELVLMLSNEGDAAMPAGLGWHPYFPRTPRTTLTARVGGLWLTDAEIMPTACVTPAPEQDPGRGLAVDRVALDNAFVGWDGQAVVAWPERGIRLRLAAPGPFGVLVVYTPSGQPFFCAEPVSHTTDAFNLAATGQRDTGMLVLAPGESVRGAFTLTPEIA